MRRTEILKAWDAEVEEEWLGLIDTTVAILERLSEARAMPEDTEAIRALHDRILALGQRRGEIWRQLAELEAYP